MQMALSPRPLLETTARWRRRGMAQRCGLANHLDRDRLLSWMGEQLEEKGRGVPKTSKESIPPPPSNLSHASHRRREEL